MFFPRSLSCLLSFSHTPLNQSGNTAGFHLQNMFWVQSVLPAPPLPLGDRGGATTTLDYHHSLSSGLPVLLPTHHGLCQHSNQCSPSKYKSDHVTPLLRNLSCLLFQGKSQWLQKGLYSSTALLSKEVATGCRGWRSTEGVVGLNRDVKYPLNFEELVWKKRT